MSNTPQVLEIFVFSKGLRHHLVGRSRRIFLQVVVAFRHCARTLSSFLLVGCQARPAQAVLQNIVPLSSFSPTLQICLGVPSQQSPSNDYSMPQQCCLFWEFPVLCAHKRSRIV